MNSLSSHRTVAEHSARVRAHLAQAVARRTEPVLVTAALGRVLAEDVRSPLDLPVFRNSQMDGFAVAAESVRNVPVTLPVAATVAAGDTGHDRLEPGTAVRIMTGAPIPAGADAVVPVEDTDATADEVTVRVPRRASEYVRERGSDLLAGDVLLPAGTVLAARHLAMFAAVGMVELPILRRPRVAVISTGSELVPAGVPLRPGQIYDSNALALAASLEANGAAVVAVDRSADNADRFREILHRATTLADVVITSGGVSMGEFEVVRDVLTPLGGWFGHVAMQPGGPQGLAVVDGVPVLNFPGNPVSTLVSFEVFARAELRRAGGLPPVPEERATLTVDVNSMAGKRQFQRGRRVDGGVSVESGPGSHLVAALARADVLVDIPADVTRLAAGAEVRVWPL